MDDLVSGDDPVSGDRRLTVVVLNDFCHVQGGASKVAIDEALGLAQAGLDVIFLGAVGPVCEALRNARLRTICLDQPELLDVMRHPLVALQGMWNRAAWAEATRIFAGLDPRRSIVHLHGYTKALSTSPLRAAERAGIPIICTLHDFFAACPNGAFFDYQAGVPCPRTALSFSCIAAHCDKRHRAHKAFRVARAAAQRLDAFPRRVHHYVTLSRRSAGIMRPYLPDDAHLYPLANIVEAPEAPPVDVARNQALVHVGRLDEEKGVRLLAEAAARARRPLVLVGDGPLRAALEGRPGLRITGWVSPAEVQAELSAARALAFPSLWYETFGLVVDEAASRGVPALVSDISAAAERVRAGEAGWHVPAGDIDAWARAIAALDDDAAVSRLGAAAHAAFWQDPPTASRHVAGLRRIYAEVLAETAPDRGPGWPFQANPSSTTPSSAGSVPAPQ